MTTKDFTAAFVVDQTPEQVFNAIRDVRGWWSQNIEGGTSQLNDEFTYRNKDVHICRMRLTEVIPDKKIVWLVLDNYFQFTKNTHEWKDNRIIFEITEKDNQTQLRFTQQGLVPTEECYEICRDAWTHYIKASLYGLVTTGKGQPNPGEGRFNDELLEKHNK